MKRFVAILLCVVMLFAFSTAAFAVDVGVSSLPSDFQDIISQFDTGGHNYNFPYLVSPDLDSSSLEEIQEFLNSMETDTSHRYISVFEPSGPVGFIKIYKIPIDTEIIPLNLSSSSLFGFSVNPSEGTSVLVISWSTEENSFLFKFSVRHSGVGSVYLYQPLNEYRYIPYVINNNVPFPKDSLDNRIKFINDIASIQFVPYVETTTHNLTIHYQFADGSKAAESVTQSVESGAGYSIPSPEIDGYKPDRPVVSGTMPAEDVTVNVIYSKAAYTLTVKYQMEDGTSAFDDYSASCLYGLEYSILSPELEGYEPDRPVVSGIMPGHDLTETVIYHEAEAPAEYYTLTIHYQYEDGGQAAKPAVQSLLAGTEYNIPSPEIEGYKPDMEMVSGTMPGNDFSVVVTYTEDSSLPPDPGGGEEPGDDENPWADLWEQMQNFGDPFSSIQIPEYNGYDPFSSIQIPGYNGYDPFSSIQVPDYSGYDPFKSPFSSNNVSGNNGNPFSGLRDQMQGFSDPVLGG